MSLQEHVISFFQIGCKIERLVDVEYMLHFKITLDVRVERQSPSIYALVFNSIDYLNHYPSTHG